MLKTKDKRLICIIILSVSIVSLLTALVSGFISQIAYLTGNVWRQSQGFALGHVILGGIFAAVFFFNKKRSNLANLIMLFINVAVFVIFSVVLCCALKMHVDGGYVIYLTVSLTIMISAAFMTVSKWLLSKYNDDESVKTENV